MTLDPQAAAYLSRLDELGAPRYGEQPTAVARQAMDDGAAALFGPFEPVPYEDRTIPGPAGRIPVRVYRPEGASGLLVWFHGGGWVLGSLRSSHAYCSELAQRARCTLVNVAYRLAPEHPFPAAVDDAWAATEWALAHAPAELGVSGPVAIGGDSAGGNLSAVVALRARDRGLPLAAQLLVYPVTDANLETASYRDNALGYWLTRAGMAWFWEQYVQGEDPFHPDASPLRAESVAGVAPATVITAEYDPLRDEGEAYAARLAEAGVPVRLRRYDGLIHGFFRLPAVIDRASGALADVATAAREAFDASPEHRPA